MRKVYRLLRRIIWLLTVAQRSYRLATWLSGDVYYRHLSYLWPLARSRRERLSVLEFVLASLVFRHRVIPHRLLRRFWPTQEIALHINGSCLWVKVEAGEIETVRELYQQHVYERLPQFVPAPGWQVIDVGANVGMFTIQQAQRGAHVIAFEPNPDCYRHLEHAIRDSGLQNTVVCLPVAVGATEGEGLVVGAGFTPVDAVTSVAYARGDGAIKVPITTLDTAIAPLNIPLVDLLKIDAEGAEAAILRGATQTLTRTRRALVEYHSFALLDAVRAEFTAADFREVAHVALFPGTDIPVGVIYVERTTVPA